MGRELRTPVSYEADFHRWSFEQARLLRSGQAQRADLANIAEELETWGRSEAAALRSSLRLIVLHVLKLQAQPERATRSWHGTTQTLDADAARQDETPIRTIGCLMNSSMCDSARPAKRMKIA